MAGPGEFRKRLQQSLRAGDRLSDDAVRSLLGEFDRVRRELRREILAGTSGDIEGLLRRLDGILEESAQEISRIGLNAQAAAWAAGENSTRDLISIGTAVQGGVHAPDFEKFAPYPGFALQAPPRPVTLEATHRAFTFDRITAVTEDMRAAIRAQVLAGYIGQLSPTAVMANITHIVGIRSLPYFRELGTTGISAKAENIFRTEIMSAQNMAGYDLLQGAAEKIPELRKVWMATGDDRTRDSHIEAHGQVKQVDEPFIVGGVEGMFPGDPALPPRERARCRCRPVAYSEEWGPLDELFGDLNTNIEREKERRAALRATKAGKAKPSLPGGLMGRSPANFDVDVAEITDRTRGWMLRGVASDGYLPQEGGGPWVYFKPMTAGGFKDDVVTYLSETTKVPYIDANEFIRQWARTSNDASVQSLFIQQVAANEFDTAALSAWQKKKIRKARNLVNKRVGSTRDSLYRPLFTQWAEDPADPLRYILKPRIAEHGFESVEEVHGTLLQAMYERTQKELAEEGIDQLVVYRGASLPKKALEGVRPGDTIKVSGNALSSWTINPDVANKFATAASEGDEQIVLRMVVPRERVVGTMRTGFGCADEWEVVLSGGAIVDEAEVMRIGFRFAEAKPPRKRPPKWHGGRPRKIDEGDENADWLKILDGGKWKRRDLAAHRLALRLYKAEQRKRGGGT